METQGSLSFFFRAHLCFGRHMIPIESHTKKGTFLLLKVIKISQRATLSNSLIEKTQRVWDSENLGQSLSNTDPTAQ